MELGTFLSDRAASFFPFLFLSFLANFVGSSFPLLFFFFSLFIIANLSRVYSKLLAVFRREHLIRIMGNTQWGEKEEYLERWFGRIKIVFGKRGCDRNPGGLIKIESGLIRIISRISLYRNSRRKNRCFRQLYSTPPRYNHLPNAKLEFERMGQEGWFLINVLQIRRSKHVPPNLEYYIARRILRAELTGEGDVENTASN